MIRGGRRADRLSAPPRKRAAARSFAANLSLRASLASRRRRIIIQSKRNIAEVEEVGARGAHASKLNPRASDCSGSANRLRRKPMLLKTACVAKPSTRRHKSRRQRRRRRR